MSKMEQLRAMREAIEAARLSKQPVSAKVKAIPKTDPPMVHASEIDAPAGKFDKKAYQRELMRKRRRAENKGAPFGSNAKPPGSVLKRGKKSDG